MRACDDSPRSVLLGFLTAENVFERILTHYQNYKEEKNQFMQMFAPLIKLSDMLEAVEIPHEINPTFAGLQILYIQPKTGHRVSVIASLMSYGLKEGKVEIMSRDYDAVPMDVQDVFEYICKLQNE